MLKCKGEGLATRRYFSKVSESRHSPLLLVGAPTQGIAPSSIRTRTECSLQVDSSPLRYDESPTVIYTMSCVSHNHYREITKLPIATISINSHLT